MAKKKRVGRPSKFDPSYCDLLYEHMAEGLSYKSFAGRKDIKVNEDTLYEWEKNYKEFSDAKKMGECASLLFWEKMGVELCTGKLEGKSAAIYCFTMKNKFKWRNNDDTDIGNRSIVINIDRDDEQL